MFSRPFFRSSVFDEDPFMNDPFFDDWNDLLRNQWAEQEDFRRRRQQRNRGTQSQSQPRLTQQSQQQQSQQQQPMEIEHKYGNNTGKNNQQMVASDSGKDSGTVARPRSFWDLTSFPSWSGLTPQSIRLEWSGTEPSAKEYVVSAYLPDGMTPNDVSISMDERTHMLTMKCQNKSHEEEKDKDGHVISSRSSSSFSQRSLQLPQDVDISGITATKNQSSGSGTAQLMLHLPKLATPQQQPGVKQIKIN